MSQSEEGEVGQGAEAQPPVTVEAINEVSAVREETQENTVRLPAPLYKRLVQTYVLATPLDPPTDEDGSVTLPIEATPQYLNGYTFGRYMIALKLLVVSCFPDLRSCGRNKDKTKISILTSAG